MVGWYAPLFNDEWMSEAHGQVLAVKPVVEIIKIGDEVY